MTWRQCWKVFTKRGHLSDIIKNEEKLIYKQTFPQYLLYARPCARKLGQKNEYNIYLQGTHELMGKSTMCSDSIQRGQKTSSDSKNDDKRINILERSAVSSSRFLSIHTSFPQLATLIQSVDWTTSGHKCQRNQMMG